MLCGDNWIDRGYESYGHHHLSIIYKLKMKRPRNPFPTVDIIIEIDDGVVLIKRLNPPHGWAIPGGFVDYGESLEDCARREAKEETSLEIQNLFQFHAYSEPGRDPRFHTISTVFIAKGEGRLQAKDDAIDIGIFREGELPSPIAFDHEKILKDYFEWKRSGILPGQMRQTKENNILFVCDGNSCRSIMAEALLDYYAKALDLPLHVESAGIYPSDRVQPYTIKVLQERGIDVSFKVPVRIDPERLFRFDSIILMGSLSKDFFPSNIHGVREDWQIPDPFGKPLEFYREVMAMIDRRVLELLNHLIREGDSK